LSDQFYGISFAGDVSLRWTKMPCEPERPHETVCTQR